MVTDGSSVTAERIAADVTITLADGARFVAPGGWYKTDVEGGILLTAPELGSHIVIVSRNEVDPESAVAAAWAAYHPGLVRRAQGQDRPAREGWDRTVYFEYSSGEADERSIMALALAKGKGWTVMLYDVSDAVAERRDAQIEIVINSLVPAGYQRETFAGRSARHLDEQRINELVAMIEAARRDYGIPGVALGLIQNGRVLFAGGFGVRETGRAEPVDADTLFNVASIGKSWTTLMLAKQVAEGRFSWDSRVSALWPDFAIADAATSAAVEVRHLVCACTGMPRHDYGWLFEGETSNPQSIMLDLARARPTSALGELFQYSNMMAAAGGFFGGHMRHPDLELGAAYDLAMQELVFEPLGMTATTPDFARALAANHARTPWANDRSRQTVCFACHLPAGVACRVLPASVLCCT